jgi:hypothetical protein
MFNSSHSSRAIHAGPSLQEIEDAVGNALLDVLVAVPGAVRGGPSWQNAEKLAKVALVRPCPVARARALSTHSFLHAFSFSGMGQLLCLLSMRIRSSSFRCFRAMRKSIMPITSRPLRTKKWPVHHAHRKKKNGEKKNDHGTLRPLRTEKWPGHITPITNRKMAVVHHAYRKKKNGEKKMAMVHHAHCEKKNGRDTSRPSQKKEWQKRKRAVTYHAYCKNEEWQKHGESSLHD